jgi:paired amphipathic helix protein Sin3a
VDRPDVEHDRQRRRPDKERKAERDRRDYERDEKDVEHDSKDLDVGLRKRKPFPSANLTGAEAQQGGLSENHGINGASASSYDNKDALKSKFL